MISEILILGCGRNIQPIDPQLRSFIRSTGMKLEAVDSVSIFCYPLKFYVVSMLFALQIVYLDWQLSPSLISFKLAL